jgi:non-haem dioxygenase in morphine synthesis N-terminal
LAGAGSLAKVARERRRDTDGDGMKLPMMASRLAAPPRPARSERTMSSPVPVVDLAPWFSGDENARAAVAAQVDAALQSVGFFLLTGHGVPVDLRDRVRARARAFFALPGEAKQRYAVTVGGRGWLPPGVEANGYAEGTPALPAKPCPGRPGAGQRGLCREPPGQLVSPSTRASSRPNCSGAARNPTWLPGNSATGVPS